MAVMEDTQGRTVEEDRLAELLADAGEFFQARLWDSEPAAPLVTHWLGRASRRRSFGLRRRLCAGRPGRAAGASPRSGYSRPTEWSRPGSPGSRRGARPRALRLSDHVPDPRPRWAHPRLCRASAPISARPGRCGWSPPTPASTAARRRSSALDRAASGSRPPRPPSCVGDCVEVLKAHQDGQTNAVTVHTGGVTPEQIDEMAAGIRGGADALELDLYGVGSSPSPTGVPQRTGPAPTPVVRQEPRRTSS